MLLKILKNSLRGPTFPVYPKQPIEVLLGITLFTFNQTLIVNQTSPMTTHFPHFDAKGTNSIESSKLITTLDGSPACQQIEKYRICLSPIFARCCQCPKMSEISIISHDSLSLSCCELAMILRIRRKRQPQRRTRKIHPPIQAVELSVRRTN